MQDNHKKRDNFADWSKYSITGKCKELKEYMLANNLQQVRIGEHLVNLEDKTGARQ